MTSDAYVPRAQSLRAKFLLIVLGGTVLPLALVGFWLARTVELSGTDLLRARLDTALTRAAQEVGEQWVRRRSALLRIAEDDSVASELARDRFAARVPLRVIGGVFADLRDATQLIAVRDLHGQVRWIVDADSLGAPWLVPAADSMRVVAARGDVVTITIPVRRAGSADSVGMLEARLRTSSLVPAAGGNGTVAGAMFAVVDKTTGLTVVPLPFDASLLRQDRFSWAGESWLTANRSLEEPAIELLAAAPLSAYTLPFERAARTGLVALVFVVVVGFAVTLALTRRVTYSLEHLANAADAVSRGDLERHVEVQSRDEVGRVARAFNTMIGSLQRTLRELSQRQAVAAVGEFASALAHEIRNPLSAVRLNLQHVEEQLSSGTPLRASVAQALRDMHRLDQTVSGALRVARSGRMTMGIVDLREPLLAAMRVANVEFERRGSTLAPLTGAEPICVDANSAALEQLFLNLLLNAAQAVDAGGRAGITVASDAEHVVVTVWDTGRGFMPGGVERAFEAFYSTKPEGTGLGLTLAQRISSAHGGSIEIESSAGAGTRVHVRLRPASGNGTALAE